VFGPGGEGSGHPSEIVVELIVRESTRRKRGVERILEGWSNATSEKSCELSALESLKDLMNKQKEVRTPYDDVQWMNIKSQHNRRLLLQIPRRICLSILV
jgi:hypothetical protein